MKDLEGCQYGICCHNEEYQELKKELSQLQQENEQLKADYGNKAQVERDILKQENIDLKQKMIRILENIDVSYNEWEKWKDDLSKLKESDK
jgi:predicted RNase H-like nuclease (RuvC/YqgF family)